MLTFKNDSLSLPERVYWEKTLFSGLNRSCSVSARTSVSAVLRWKQPTLPNFSLTFSSSRIFYTSLLSRHQYL